MQVTIVHLVTVLKRRLPNIILELILLELGLSIFLVKIIQQRAGGWQPERQHADASCRRPAST